MATYNLIKNNTNTVVDVYFWGDYVDPKNPQTFYNLGQDSLKPGSNELAFPANTNYASFCIGQCSSCEMIIYLEPYSIDNQYCQYPPAYALSVAEDGGFEINPIS